MQGQLRQQIRELALAANQPHRLCHRQGGLQQAVGDRLGHRVGHAHRKVQHPATPTRLGERGFQLGTQGKNLVGIAQCQSPVFGQLKLAPPLAKKLTPQPALQQFDLPRQGLRRGVQLLACPHDAARLGSNPKIMQVLEVHHFSLFVFFEVKLL